MDGVADNFTEEIADKAAGGDGAVLNRAGGARETGEIFRQSAEAKAEAEENAAVLERLEKNGATRMNVVG